MDRFDQTTTTINLQPIKFDPLVANLMQERGPATIGRPMHSRQLVEPVHVTLVFQIPSVRP